MNDLAIEQIELAKHLRAERKRIEGELATLRVTRVTRMGSEIVTFFSALQGPLTSDGTFYSRTQRLRNGTWECFNQQLGRRRCTVPCPGCVNR